MNIWNFGHVDVQSLELRGQQLRARTLCFEGDTVSSREGCCSEKQKTTFFSLSLTLQSMCLRISEPTGCSII